MWVVRELVEQAADLASGARPREVSSCTRVNLCYNTVVLVPFKR